MPGYPIAWDDAATDGATRSAICPYDAREIIGYLGSCHFHLSRDEDPVSFNRLEFNADCECNDRHIWLWKCRDSVDRTWDVIIGSGNSPFYKDKRDIFRWIYAETSSGNDEPHRRLEQLCIELSRYGTRGEH